MKLRWADINMLNGVRNIFHYYNTNGKVVIYGKLFIVKLKKVSFPVFYA